MIEMEELDEHRQQKLGRARAPTPLDDGEKAQRRSRIKHWLYPEPQNCEHSLESLVRE